MESILFLPRKTHFLKQVRLSCQRNPFPESRGLGVLIRIQVLVDLHPSIPTIVFFLVNMEQLFDVLFMHFVFVSRGVIKEKKIWPYSSQYIATCRLLQP